MAVTARPRLWSLQWGPYRSPVLNALHRLVWLAAFLVILVGIYLVFIPHTWLAGPGADTQVILEPLTVNPHPAASLWAMEAPIVGIVAIWIGGMLFVSRNRSLGLKLQPFIYLIWLAGMLLYLPLQSDERLQATPAGLAYRWGFIHYDQITAYRWTTPYGYYKQYTSTGTTKTAYGPAYYGLLTVTLKPGPMLPHTLQWAILNEDERPFNTILAHYLPGRGNQPPGPRMPQS